MIVLTGIGSWVRVEGDESIKSIVFSSIRNGTGIVVFKVDVWFYRMQ